MYSPIWDRAIRAVYWYRQSALLSSYFMASLRMGSTSESPIE